MADYDGWYTIVEDVADDYVDSLARAFANAVCDKLGIDLTDAIVNRVANDMTNAICDEIADTHNGEDIPNL